MLGIVMVLALVSTAAAVPCDMARLRCAFRTGCGKALEMYLMGCTAILQETPADHCPEMCQNALIALYSTDEGKDLMTCECADDFCRETKQRMEICRPHVMKAVKNDTVVSCEVAQWICAADATCSTALEYYHKYCQSMFYGRKCSFRCKNSISILKKQEKAAKLDSCRCNGKEEFDCPRIRINMAKLCFNKTVEITEIIDVDSNDIKSILEKNNELDKEFSNSIDSSSCSLPSLTNLIVTLFITCRYFLMT